MPIFIDMPRLSDTMQEGTLVKWSVKVGDKVGASSVIGDVETDKATMELQVFDEGTIAKLCIEAGQTVPIGTIIAVIAAAGETVEAAAAAPLPAAAAPAPAPKKEEAAPAAAVATAQAQVSLDDLKISPLAKKIAAQGQVNLSGVEGSGPGGRIIRRDVLKAAASPAAPVTLASIAAPAPAKAAAPAAPVSALTGTLEAKSIPLSNMRKTIAKRLVESKQSVPHFQVSVAVRMDALMTTRAQLASQGIKFSVNDFITRAIAIATSRHPAVNSSWNVNTIEQHGTVNVGVAISLPAEKGGGLVVATVKDAHTKGVRQISDEVKALATKAREKGLTPAEMEGSTITLSNLGMPQYGVVQFNPIVNLPNAAIIGVGAAIEQPVVENGKIVVGTVMSTTLSGDHRVIDGAQGAEFLTTLKGLLENPAALLV